MSTLLSLPHCDHGVVQVEVFDSGDVAVAERCTANHFLCDFERVLYRLDALKIVKVHS
jgi:hypothetical protein